MAQFDLKELNLSNCVVDRSKLNWLNTHHIRREIGKSRIKNTMSLSDINKLQITDPNDALVQACSFIAPEIPKRINAKQAIEISVPLDLSDTFELEGRSFTYGYTLAAMLAQHVSAGQDSILNKGTLGIQYIDYAGSGIHFSRFHRISGTFLSPTPT